MTAEREDFSFSFVSIRANVKQDDGEYITAVFFLFFIVGSGLCPPGSEGFTKRRGDYAMFSSAALIKTR